MFFIMFFSFWCLFVSFFLRMLYFWLMLINFCWISFKFGNCNNVINLDKNKKCVLFLVLFYYY